MSGQSLLSILRTAREDIDASPIPRTDTALAQNVSIAMMRISTMNREDGTPYSPLQRTIVIRNLMRHYDKGMSR